MGIGGACPGFGGGLFCFPRGLLAILVIARCMARSLLLMLRTRVLNASKVSGTDVPVNLDMISLTDDDRRIVRSSLIRDSDVLIYHNLHRNNLARKIDAREDFISDSRAINNEVHRIVMHLDREKRIQPNPITTSESLLLLMSERRPAAVVVPLSLLASVIVIVCHCCKTPSLPRCALALLLALLLVPSGAVRTKVIRTLRMAPAGLVCFPTALTLDDMFCISFSSSYKTSYRKSVIE